LIISTVAFYEADSSVVTLTVDNFNTDVIESKGLWLVEFYAPWCGHCKSLTPEWEKAARGLKGFVSMGAVDMTVHGEVGKAYNVEGYPTLKWFGEDKTAPVDFDGGRTSTGIINFAVNKIKELANSRIGNKKKPKAEKPKKEEEKEKKEEDTATGDDDVIVLTDDNFAELVEGS
jgi:protein disulfide-isomerase A6